MGQSREKEIQKLKDELIVRKEQITKHLADVEAGLVELQEYNEQNDVMSKQDESAGGLTEILADTEIKATLEKTLKDIKQALELMEKGGYGVCKYCKKDISIQRLKIRPVSTSCVACKSQFTN